MEKPTTNARRTYSAATPSARGRRILDVSRTQLRRDTRMGRIRPPRIVVEMLRQHVDEAADLRRKMVAMGIYGVDGMLRLQKLGQDRNETARFDFVDEQKALRQREAFAVHV